jgi:hypothetical protein
MKLRALAGIGALAAGLLLASSAGALTVVTANYNGTTFTLTQNSATDLTFEIQNAQAGWGTTAVDLGAFAFNNIGGAGDPLVAEETSPSVNLGMTVVGGLNSGGCDTHGNFVCFDWPSSGAGSVAVTADPSALFFDISTTGATPFDLTGSGQNAPDLKIQFLDSSGDKVGSLFSNALLNSSGGQTFNVPEPATWMMMIVGVGMVGGVLRRRRKLALATA